ncbi:MAG: RidA family protein [Gemmatimonadales bacterium]
MSELPPAAGKKPLYPDGWAFPRGYSHGVVASGRQVILAGQVGWNPRTLEFESDDLMDQIRQTLENVVTLLTEAEALPRHLVRLTWYITDRAEYIDSQHEIGVAYREIMGTHYPPMAMVVVKALIQAQAKVEIEATAIIPE